MKLLRLDIQCPRCGRKPAFQIPESERELAQQQPTSALKGTVQCQHCGRIYEVTARAYHGAA